MHTVGVHVCVHVCVHVTKSSSIFVKLTHKQLNVVKHSEFRLCWSFWVHSSSSVSESVFTCL